MRPRWCGNIACRKSSGAGAKRPPDRFWFGRPWFGDRKMGSEYSTPEAQSRWSGARCGGLALVNAQRKRAAMAGGPRLILDVQALVKG